MTLRIYLSLCVIVFMDVVSLNKIKCKFLCGYRGSLYER